MASISSAGMGAGATGHSGLRVAVGVLGAATAVVGIVLLFNPVAAARTLALLMGLAFVLGGVLEIAEGWDTRWRWASAALGAVLVIGGLLAVVWPGITLWVLALITGLSLIAHGVGRIGVAVTGRDEIKGWGWLAAAGAFGLILGVVALVWPQATVLVLSLILGLQVTVFGLLLLAAAFWHPARTSAT